MTDDFEAAVSPARTTGSWCRPKLRAKETREAGELAARAETGMRIIEAEMTLLTPPDAAELDAAYARSKELHGDAFGWAAAGRRRAGAARRHPDAPVRAGVDQRMGPRPAGPGARPETVVVDVRSDYREDTDLDPPD